MGAAQPRIRPQGQYFDQDCALREGGDTLISKLVDGQQEGESGYGELGGGDMVVMGQYPTNFAPSSFGSWQTTSHTVFDVLTNQHVGPFPYDPAATCVRSLVDNSGDFDGTHFCWVIDTFGETFLETRLANIICATHIDEGNCASGLADYVGQSGDAFLYNPLSPSNPQTLLEAQDAAGGSVNSRFIDVSR